MIMPPDLTASITAIHAAPHRLVYVFAGAGSFALAWLHAVAGSSATVLAAVDVYAPRALLELTGQAGGAAVSEGTAQAMATWAYRRARDLSDGDWPVLGIGLTAAIITTRQRRGADRAILAVQQAEGMRIAQLTLGRAERQRLDQEALISRWVIAVIAGICGAPLPAVPLAEGDRLDP